MFNFVLRKKFYNLGPGLTFYLQKFSADGKKTLLARKELSGPKIKFWDLSDTLSMWPCGGLYIVTVSVVQNPDKNVQGDSAQGDGGVVHIIHVPTIVHMVFILR